MPFTYPADQKRLWTALKITRRDELLQSSCSKLYRLMTDLEQFDTRNNTTLVTDVLAKLTAVEALEAKIAAKLATANPRNTRREESYLEGSVDYEGQSLLSIWQQQKDELLQEVRNLLDPCGCFTVQYGFAEVIAT